MDFKEEEIQLSKIKSFEENDLICLRKYSSLNNSDYIIDSIFKEILSNNKFIEFFENIIEKRDLNAFNLCKIILNSSLIENCNCINIKSSFLKLKSKIII